MTAPTIEIHGTGSWNRGAELMAIAIADRLRSAFPGCRIAVPPQYGPFESRCRQGYLTTTDFRRPWPARVYGLCMPASVRRRVGAIRPREVDIVLDASGFSFSDQWGASGALALLEKMRRRERRRQPLVLLPQAFGPFRDRRVANAVRQLLARASLVFPRDAMSRDYLLELEPDRHFEVSPDFTTGVQPILTPDAPSAPYVAIVPNYRMLDKSGFGDRYLGFLCDCIAALKRFRMKPVFVIHDGDEDLRIVGALPPAMRTVPILSHPDPRAIKYVLGKATLVVGSRYHALAGALSQGVPCIGMGWSHKYEALFEEFDCPELLLRDPGDANTMVGLLEWITSPGATAEVKARLCRAAGLVLERNETMWGPVEALVLQQIRAHV